MSKQIRCRIWSMLVLLTMVAPVVLAPTAHSQSTGTSTTVTSNQTGTDPEPPPDPPGSVVIDILLIILSAA